MQTIGWGFAALLVFLLCFSGGCAQQPCLHHTAQELGLHVIVVDGSGSPHYPVSGKKMDMPAFRKQMADMFHAIAQFRSTHPDHKVLIFVHGGLNAPQDSLQQADGELDDVRGAGYYAIYLNWNSGLLPTYGEHAWRVTQGQTDDGWVRKLLTPFYVIADVGRAVTRIPVVWSNQIGTDAAAARADLKALAGARGQRWASLRQGESAATTFRELRYRQDLEKREKSGEPRREMRVCIGPDLDLDAGHLAGLGFSYIVTSPAKFGFSWVLDGVGTPAWDNMSRRTMMAFDGEIGGDLGIVNARGPTTARAEPRNERASHATDFRTTGALAVFRDELFTAIKNDHVTLVGHSMGTIILNEWLRRDVAEDRKQFYCNIVYMAAACSVRDFTRSVVPYLMQHRPNPKAADAEEKAGTQFYNLMLHPIADLRERGRAYDIPPRGSLLVWLDDFLTDPRGPLDRTMGRWDNIIPATDVIPREIRGQVSLKAFALAPYPTEQRPCGMPNYGPQAHGQFRGNPYWCPEFWYSETKEVPACKSARGLSPAATKDESSRF